MFGHITSGEKWLWLSGIRGWICTPTLLAIMRAKWFVGQLLSLNCEPGTIWGDRMSFLCVLWLLCKLHKERRSIPEGWIMDLILDWLDPSGLLPSSYFTSLFGLWNKFSANNVEDFSNQRHGQTKPNGKNGPNQKTCQQLHTNHIAHEQSEWPWRKKLKGQKRIRKMSISRALLFSLIIALPSPLSLCLSERSIICYI